MESIGKPGQMLAERQRRAAQPDVAASSSSRCSIWSPGRRCTRGGTRRATAARVDSIGPVMPYDFVVILVNSDQDLSAGSYQELGAVAASSPTSAALLAREFARPRRPRPEGRSAGDGRRGRSIGSHRKHDQALHAVGELEYASSAAPFDRTLSTHHASSYLRPLLFLVSTVSHRCWQIGAGAPAPLRYHGASFCHSFSEAAPARHGASPAMPGAFVLRRSHDGLRKEGSRPAPPVGVRLVVRQRKENPR